MRSIIPFAVPAIALMLGGVSCTHQQKEPEPSGSRWDQIVNHPDDKKVSPLQDKYFKSKQFTTKTFKTKEGGANWSKEFKGTKDFNTKPYQENSPLAKRSKFEGENSRLADKKAPTKDFVGADKKAPTKEFAESDKVATGMKKAHEATKVYATTENHVASAAQKDSLRQKDLTLSELPSSSAAPGTISQSAKSSKGLHIGSLDLSPDAGSVGGSNGKPMSIDDVRIMLNKGHRPD